MGNKCKVYVKIHTIYTALWESEIRGLIPDTFTLDIFHGGLDLQRGYTQSHEKNWAAI